MKKAFVLVLLAIISSVKGFALTPEGIEYNYTLIDGLYYRLFDDAVWVSCKTRIDYVDFSAYISADYSGKLIIPESVIYEGKEYVVSGVDDNAFINSTIDTLIVPKTIKRTGVNWGGQVDKLFIDSWEWWNSLTIGNSFERAKEELDMGRKDWLSSANHVFVGGEECDLSHLVLPEGLTSIRDFAFTGCDTIKSITLPSTVTSLGEYCFSKCNGLTSVSIPDQVTYLGSCAFQYCSSLEELVIGDGIQDILEHSFQQCENLNTVSVGHGLKTINGFDGTYISKFIIRDLASWCVLKGAERLMRTDSSKEPHLLFDSDGNEILDVVVPGGVKEIGKHCFSHSVIKSVSLPASITAIKSSAFSSCKNLYSIVMPDNSMLKSVDEYAFYNCSKLNSISIPDQTETIGNHAFNGCTNLSSVTIGRNVTHLGSMAFNFYSWEKGKPRMVVSRIEKPYAFDNDVFNEITYREGLLTVPSGTKDRYGRLDGWRNFLTIEESDMNKISSQNADEKKPTGNSRQLFDLQGRRLIQKPEKGMYILNGQKYIVK